MQNYGMWIKMGHCVIKHPRYDGCHFSYQDWRRWKNYQINWKSVFLNIWYKDSCIDCYKLFNVTYVKTTVLRKRIFFMNLWNLIHVLSLLQSINSVFFSDFSIASHFYWRSIASFPMPKAGRTSQYFCICSAPCLSFQEKVMSLKVMYRASRK